MEISTLTRDQFEAGVPFKIKTASKLDSEKVYQFDAPDEDDYRDGSVISLDPYRYIANVEKIDDAGFTFYTYILGRIITRKALFTEFFPCKFRGKNNQS